MNPEQIEQSLARLRAIRKQYADEAAMLCGDLLGYAGDETPGALGVYELPDYDAKTLIEWSKR